MNHIQNIEIQNFKSIKQCNIDGCKRINVFVGPPNVGKSNILEGMGLCSLIEGNSRSQFLNDYIRYEKASSLFYNKNINNGFGVYFNNDFAVLGNFEGNKNRLAIKHFDSLENIKLNRTNYIIYTSDEKENPETFIEIFSNMGFGENYRELKAEKIKKYQFRENIKLKDYNSNELQIPFGENIGTFLAYQKGKLFEAIQALVAPNSFEIESNGNIRYKKENINGGFPISFNYNEIADTLQRLIFHLTAIMSNKDSVLLFEEPEAQMYPPYISKLTGEIIADENNNQFFIATHSPFVLNDLMEDAKDDLAIYIVYEKVGETKVQRMDEQEIKDAYQFGSDFFMNIPNFIKA